jgi:hypothetical protein
MQEDLDRPSLAEFGRGRCVNCGFLSKKDTQDFMADLQPVSISERKAGEFRVQRWSFTVTAAISQATEFAPFCAKRVIALPKLAEAYPSFT